MPPLARKPTLLLILILLLSSCAPQIPSPQGTQPSLPPPIEQTPTPALISTLESTALPAATQKPPRNTKVPGGQGQGQRQGGGSNQTLTFEIPSHPFDVILGCPTSNSIVLSLLAYTSQTISISYGTASGYYTNHAAQIALEANVPQLVQLSNLQPDTQYFYSINGGSENTFHTARASGSTFTFAIQADSHLDSNSNPQVYLQTLANERASHPDFVIDLGDTFMTEKYKPYTAAEPQYLAQRYFFSQLADTAPLFLVLGNHDGEGAPRGNAGTDISTWAAGMRIKYFPNPAPDSFYTGNTTPNSAVGNLEDYYAWAWGDALFIILDPYWFTPPQHSNTADLWNPTLGETQYQWLKNTLETSHAKWKFIFIHQLVGGLDKDGRGGVEAAKLYEWGGNNADGSYGFDEYRSGWGLPIHQLLVANHVTAVFHGHDHLFVHQELDGIVYQEVPQPASARANNTSSAVEYGYISGTVLGGPGYVRVTVTPQAVTVDYIRSFLPQDENASQQNGMIDYTYTITIP